MGRRGVGGVVVLLVPMVVLLVGVARRPVVGLATAPPVPGPPAVGACLTTPVATAQVSQDNHVVHLAGTFDACTTARFGEVVALLPPGLPASGDPDQPDAYVPACEQRVLAWSGARTETQWSPSGYVGTMVLGPSDRQLAAGQRWAACVAVVSDTAGRTAALTASLRDVFDPRRTTLPPSALAQCYLAMDTAVPPVDCGQPHRVEVLAVIDVPLVVDADGRVDSGATPMAAVTTDDSCRQAVTRLTGLPDPTAGARLRIEAITDLGSALCAAVAQTGHVLTGPVLGLGDRPLPLR